MDVHAALIRAAIGPLWARWEGSPYLRHYRRLRATQFDDPATIQARQCQQMTALVAHAQATVPFYRRRLREAGLTPSAIQTIDDWQRLPVLTKADLRAAGPDLLSEPYRGAKLRRKTTSGSTGVSLEVLVDEPAMQFKRACTLRCDEWSGWRFGERVAKVWGNPDYLRHGWRGRLRNAVLDRATYLDTLHLTEEALDAFAARLRRRQPGLLFGHAHSLFLFADYLRQRGTAGIRPHGIIATAMVLHEWQRRVIEQVFGCPVTNRYGCEEVSLIACECERHQGLHVNSDGVFVEILREGKPALPGEAGHVVVTDLVNRAMPLIRYQVGDVAVVSDRWCACGRGLPLLERIEGREADYVVTARGELISGISLTENFALEVPGIAQLQIVQEAVERFLFRIVRGPEFGPVSMRRLGALVRSRFGEGTAFDCEFVERIPQEPSGKYRFCISHVANPFTQPRETAAV
jgi:phenylacetate-CoA ligase